MFWLLQMVCLWPWCLSVEVSAFSSLGSMPRRIARSYSDVLRKCLCYHKSSCVSHSQRLRVPWTEQPHWIKGSPVPVQALPAKRYLAPGQMKAVLRLHGSRESDCLCFKGGADCTAREETKIIGLSNWRNEAAMNRWGSGGHTRSLCWDMWHLICSLNI